MKERTRSSMISKAVSVNRSRNAWKKRPPASPKMMWMPLSTALAVLKILSQWKITANSLPLSSAGSQQQSSTGSSIGGHKRLYRNENDKVLGGCLAATILISMWWSCVSYLWYCCFPVQAFSISLCGWCAQQCSMEIGGHRKKLFRRSRW